MRTKDWPEYTASPETLNIRRVVVVIGIPAWQPDTVIESRQSAPLENRGGSGARRLWRSVAIVAWAALQDMLGDGSIRMPDGVIAPVS
jgi:hypothetical protein